MIEWCSHISVTRSCESHLDTFMCMCVCMPRLSNKVMMYSISKFFSISIFGFLQGCFVKMLYIKIYWFELMYTSIFSINTVVIQSSFPLFFCTICHDSSYPLKLAIACSCHLVFITLVISHTMWAPFLVKHYSIVTVPYHRSIRML